MTKTYSLSTDGRRMKLSEHFVLAEFACRSGEDNVLVDDGLVNALEQIRSWANAIIPGSTIFITSGYRTYAHNKEIGGEKNSQHCLGKAADFKIRKPNGEFVKPQTVYDAIESGEATGSSWSGGLGLYETWIHIDTRDMRARWKG